MTATPGLIGRPITRVDGRAKVTGAARYAAEFNQPGQCHAVLVTATIGLGRVLRVHERPVLAMPGVLAVISHRNAPRLAYAPNKSPIDPGIGERLHVLQDDAVRFHGQPVAVVVAETIEQAEHAGHALRIEYEAAPPIVAFEDLAVKTIVPEASRGAGARVIGDRFRGNADTAIAASAFRVDAVYDVAREIHYPMEPHATVAAWQGDRLKLWSKSQFVVAEQAEIAAIFGLEREKVEVSCPFIGGAFGTSLRTWPHVTLAALAAREVGRPVKLVLNRRQMGSITGHRPRTRQRVSLGCDSEGHLTGIVHEGTGETSRYEEFVEALTTVTDYMYAAPSVRQRYRLLPTDTSTPTFMRGPGESTGMFALESAMDEMAHQLGMDPVELRRRNEPTMDQGTGLPFSSRSLLQCYALGASKFGWARRTSLPGSMRDGRLQVGWGMASATYPVFHSPASARARMLSGGLVEIEAAASDMGPGTYTSMTQVAAETLGTSPDRVRFQLGQSRFPPTPSHGGSQTMASVGSAIRAACLLLQEEIARRACASPASPFFGLDVGSLSWREGQLISGTGRGLALTAERIVSDLGGQPVEAQASAARPEGLSGRFSTHAFGAVFVEVAVDPDVGTVQVRRVVGAYAAGRIVNPLLAASQCTGGMVGGIGMALMEQAVLDADDGRPVNAHMADYLVPVNLDIGHLEACFVDEVDPHVNALGVKGLGEIALIGVAPAIANAIFHATGRRIRQLPIRLEHTLASGRAE
ncbi:xanthine dehydrogenase family protein molybdopterin-binding subunit [Roseomonas sp. WA12]